MPNKGGPDVGLQKDMVGGEVVDGWRSEDKRITSWRQGIAGTWSLSKLTDHLDGSLFSVQYELPSTGTNR